MASSDRLEKLALELFDVQALRFGDFITKSGMRSPVYLDLRVIISYPELLEKISIVVSELLGDVECDVICGVPYTALPIATVVSIQKKLPMLIRRKETKEYGTKKKIEGVFKKGDSCVIIEDVITSGSSVLETAIDLRNEGLKVSQAVIILDREQGGSENLLKNKIQTKSLFTMMIFMEILLKANKIDEKTYKIVQEYFKDSPIGAQVTVQNDRLKMPFGERHNLTNNIIGKRLFKLMLQKKTNLCLAADLTSCGDIIRLFENVGPHICMLKLHVDMIEDFTRDFIIKIRSLSEKYNVILMEDRKYSDIGNTVSLQCSSGVFKINTWADVVTVHSLPGKGVLDGVRSAFNDRLKGLFVVAEMSSKGNLITSSYTEASIKMLDDNSDAYTGVVCQSKDVIKNPGLIQLTPGVKLEKSGDELGQVYNSPEDIILHKGADIAVVGRGIINAIDSTLEAQKYKEILWKCYEERINF